MSNLISKWSQINLRFDFGNYNNCLYDKVQKDFSFFLILMNLDQRLREQYRKEMLDQFYQRFS
jgi:hypothetical protein